jgi:hypothetical protein
MNRAKREGSQSKWYGRCASKNTGRYGQHNRFLCVHQHQHQHQKSKSIKIPSVNILRLELEGAFGMRILPFFNSFFALKKNETEDGWNEDSSIFNSFLPD